MKLFNLNWILHKLALLVAGSSLITFATVSQAGTLVRINTTLGSVTLELFDDVAPSTVANFLNYVNSDRYNGTFIHRSEPGFVIQGGWLTFNESTQALNAISVDPNIVNEFKLSNTRGTVAMAKVAGDPDSANSQWFVNLADNAGLDSDNGGYTVFGKIVDNGMTVIDAIAALPRGVLSPGFSPTPLIDFVTVPLKSANLVNLTMSVIANTSPAPNVYDAESALLYTTIDAGPDGLLTLAFSLFSITPEVVIQALPSTVAAASAPVANLATFDGTSGRVIIPEFVINGEVAFRNVIFELSDIDQLLFRLIAAD